MALTVTRDLSVVYGSTVIGGTSDLALDASEKIQIDRRYDSASLSCTFIVVGSDDATFNTNVAAAETALRTPRERVQLIQGSETLLDWNPSDNSGFDADASCTKAGGAEDTGRSRKYRFSVTVAQPANLAGQAGRRNDSTVAISFSPSRRRSVTVSGTYTALSGNEATAQYDASIAAYTTSVLNAIGGTYELTAEQTQRNDTDKTVTFTRSFQEIAWLNESVGTATVAAIVNQQLTVSRAVTAPGDVMVGGVTPKRLVPVNVNYSCSVDHDEVTDLQGFWDSTIRPHVIAEAQSQASMESFALIEEQVSYDEVQNTIQASMTFHTTNGSDLIESTSSQTISDVTGKQPIKVLNGKEFTHVIFETGPVRNKTIQSNTLRVAGSTGTANIGGSRNAQLPGFRGGSLFVGNIQGIGVNFGGGDAGGQSPVQVAGGAVAGGGIPEQAQEQWVDLDSSSQKREYRIGQPEYAFDLVAEQKTIRFIWIKPYSAGPAPVITRRF